MAIRIFPILLLFSACSCSQAPVPSQSQVTQDLDCEYQRYPCDPDDLSSGWICTSACGYTATCRPHTSAEEQFCATHPDYFLDAERYCTPEGNPSWNTWCQPLLIVAPKT